MTIRRGAAVMAVGIALWAAGGCDGVGGGPDREEASSRASGTTAAAAAGTLRAGSLVVEALVVAEPATPDRTAFFGTVRNEGERDDVLLDVEVPDAADASLHRSEMEDGVVRMRPVDSLAVPAGGDLRLRPGGIHGMIEAPPPTWAAGDTVRLRLRFRAAGDVDVPAVVVPYGALGELFGEGRGGG